MNYQEEMEKILADVKGKPTLLLHSCCAPCSSHVLSILAPFFEITVFYYNPNITAQEEYEKRKQEQIHFLKQLPYPIDYVDLPYDATPFYEISRGLETSKEGGIRCFSCYRLRLSETAHYAKVHRYDYFGTTLTVSPYKNAKKINEIGLELAKKETIHYLVSDFKKKDGYKHSIELSKQYHLYRQNYCGCIYSKGEDKNE